MDFTLKVRFVEMAEQHNTVEYTEYNTETGVLHISFANGTSWHIQVNGGKNVD